MTKTMLAAWRIDSTELLIARGWTTRRIRVAVGAGALVRLHRDRFVEADHPLLATPWDRHRLRCVAVASANPASVLGFHSAAAVRGLPIITPPGGRVHLVGASANGTGSIRRHQAGPELQVERVHEVPMTAVLHTLADLASVDLDSAVAAADGALHAGHIGAGELEALGETRARAGAETIRFLAGFADGRAESAGESISRLRMHQVGLPAPEPQFEVVVEGRRYRSDFGWRHRRLLGEFDGMQKYGGVEGREALAAEKRREDALRRAGFRVVRWTWRDIGDPEHFRLYVAAKLGIEGVIEVVRGVPGSAIVTTP